MKRDPIPTGKGSSKLPFWLFHQRAAGEPRPVIGPLSVRLPRARRATRYYRASSLASGEGVFLARSRGQQPEGRRHVR